MNTKFTPYQIQECLFDKKRTNSFKQAIEETVKKGDTVVDAGSGSGILGLFAAKAGAKKVYCVESNQRFIEIIKKNAALNDLSQVISVILGDATKIKLPCKVDVIICELLSTGFFFEPEVEVINNLRKYLRNHGKIIPSSTKSFIQLIRAQKDLYGLHLNYDSRYEMLSNDKSMSDIVVFDKQNFYRYEPFYINKKVILIAKKTGLVNAVRITSKATLSEHVYANKSRFLFNPLLVHIDKIKVMKNKNIKFTLDIKKARIHLEPK